MLYTNPVTGGHIELGPDGLFVSLFALPTVGAPVNTVIAIALLVAEVGDAQVAFEVITTVIVEGSASDVVV
jgi:hypothetical protein